VVFIQAGMPSRTQIESYRNLMERTDSLAEAINDKYGTPSWKPVIMLTRQLTPVSLNAMRRLGDFCIVSSLHDGMNLVAKEYVAARSDEDGVLILSRFTGAAEELTDSLLINPFDTSEFAAMIKKAVEMTPAERKRRMKKMRRIVAANNIYRWGADQVDDLISIAGL
jgi:trehalose-6-phosphate synthase